MVVVQERMGERVWRQQVLTLSLGVSLLREVEVAMRESAV
jgi:hypothetical protein